MPRTVISLSDEDKAWLDRMADREHVSMTELVRRAVRVLRDRMNAKEPSFEDLLERTRGTWKHGDGLAWQRRLRDEW